MTTILKTLSGWIVGNIIAIVTLCLTVHLSLGEWIVIGIVQIIFSLCILYAEYILD